MKIETEIFTIQNTETGTVRYQGQRKFDAVFAEVEEAVKSGFDAEANALDYLAQDFFFKQNKDAKFPKGHIFINVAPGGSEGYRVGVIVLQEDDKYTPVFSAKLFSESGAFNFHRFVYDLFY